MNAWKLFTAVGAGVTTALLVAVVIIELLQIEFSALVGLPVGVITGIIVTVWLGGSFDELPVGVRRAATAYAAFGMTILAVFAVRYVNLGRNVLSVEVAIGLGLAAVGVVYLALLRSDRALP